VKVTERMVIGVATGLLVVAGVIAGLLTGNIRGFYFPFSEAVLGIAFVVAGVIVTRTRPDHQVGRLMLWIGLIVAAAQFASAFDAEDIGGATDVGGGLDIAAGLLRFTSIVLIVALVARFPDGSWTTPWSRRLFFLTSGCVVAFIGLTAAGQLGAPITEDQAALPFLAVPALSTVLVVVVVVHLLRADPVRRRQVGWVLLALGVSVVQELVLEGFGVDLGPAEGVVRAVVILLIPTSIVIAVTRFRLYEIDRVMSRTVSYGLLVGAMFGVFFGMVALLTLVLPLGGDLPVAIATLTAVAVSVPLMRRVRRWVDRRFFRSRYDAAAVVARVADDLRTTVDMAEVESRAESVISEVFAPESVGVWVAE
jgi:hypothetical protein